MGGEVVVPSDAGFDVAACAGAICVELDFDYPYGVVLDELECLA